MNEILFAEIYYICVAIMLILGFKTYHSMMKNSQKVSFLAVVLVHILYFQTDLVRMTTNGQDLFLNEMCFLFFSLCTLSWFNYIQTMLEVHYVKKSQTLFAMIPVFASVVLLLVNTLNGCLFQIDSYGNFQEGPLYILYVFINDLYFMVGAYQAYVYSCKAKNYQQKKSNQILAIYMGSLLLIGTMQDFFRDIPVFCVGTSLSILIVYISLEEQMISIDPLTQLNNRNRMEQHLFECVRSQDLNMYLLVLDVNRFKKINDEYGHTQGDLALKAIANCLKESCIEKSDFIARYGGDEFVIVYKGNDVEGLCQRIHAYIRKLSFPFDLDVSIGCAPYHKDIHKWNDWFIEADKQLYEFVKQQHIEASKELSYSSEMSDLAYRKWNSSAYHRNSKGNLIIDRKLKVGSDVPKSINMNIKIPTQKYKKKYCYSI